MGLTTTIERLGLPLEFPFTIARGTRESAKTVLVKVEDDDGRVGVGAAAPSARYGETIGTVEAVLPRLTAIVEAVDDPHDLDRVGERMRTAVRANPAAKAAIDIALHDLAAKRVGLPLYRYWGLDASNTVETSYTIGIDTPERMREKTALALDRGHSILKVKLGTDRDEELVETVRSAAPDASIRVDANEAWGPREAVERIERLIEYDVDFVEQPVPAERDEALGYVHERSPLPIAVDESCVTVEDLPRIADRADIANVKLMKCGGPREARRMLEVARALGLETMLGCMLESNASIAAACHLAPLLDYADLDGALLLESDPFEGVAMPGGAIDLAGLDRPGTGAR